MSKKAFDKIADKTKDKVEEKMGDMGKKTN